MTNAWCKRRLRPRDRERDRSHARAL